jgi:signal peptidase I
MNGARADQVARFGAEAPLAAGGATAIGGASAAGGEPGTRARRGRADRRRQARKAQRRRRRSLLREIPVILVVAVGITLLLQTFLVQVFSIPSGSMQQTIQIGDRVVVNKLSPWFGWHPHRGDVVVFKDPGQWLDASSEAPSHDGPVVSAVKSTFTALGLLPSDQNLIKRVIGVPGDVVACCDKQGRLTVNGTPLDERYVYPGNAPSNIRFEVRVPQGDLWVMGDHRDLSADSRYHMGQRGGGFVPESDVVGRAIAIVWPVGRWQTLPEPPDFSAVPTDSGGASASGPSELENLGRSSALAGAGPIPLELPLVMGVAAAWPRVRARWRRRR